MNDAASQPTTVCEMFEWRRAHDGDVPFVITPDATERTYRQLGERVDALAAELAAHGVGAGDIVGVYCWNDPAWIVAAFATWSTGASIAACGGLTPLPEVHRRFGVVSPKLAVVTTGLPQPDGVVSIEVSSEGIASERRETTTATKISPTPDSTAAILFTSGTTGASKPVVFSHQRLADGPRMTAGAYASSADFRPRTAPGNKPPAISFNPFGHAASLGRMVFRMYVGRSILLVPKFDVAVLKVLASRYPLDTLQLTPAMIHAVAYTDEDIELGSLKYVNSGTAPLPIATRERFEARYSVPVLQAYGATEGGVTALERYEDVVAGRRGPGSVGRVPSNMPFRIVDSDCNDVSPGGEGELVGRVERRSMLSSDGEEAIRVDSDGWYHTGDLARVDEHGILYITGRLKEMMIVGGFNVYPSEVEDVLRRSPSVRDAVVVPKPDDRLGEMPIAGIVWEPSAATGSAEERIAELRAYCRATLEAYKVPRQWFVLDDLPLTANGKLDRNAAAELGGIAVGAQQASPEQRS